MAKQVQKTSSKKLKLYIITSIKNHSKLPDDVPRNKCNYHLKPFLKAGLIRKEGYGVWKLTKLGDHYFNTNKFKLEGVVGNQRTCKTHNSKLIRGHAFRWKLKLPKRAFYSVSQRKKVLLLAKIKGTELDNKTIKFTLRDHIVHLASRTIIIYFNKDYSFMGKSALASYKEALFEFNKLIVTLERFYGVSLRIRKQYKFKLFGNHYGDLENAFAVKCQKEGQFVRVFDEGKEWLVIDFSHGSFREMETVNPDRAKFDMDSIITPFMNRLHKEPRTLDKMEERMNQMQRIMDKQTTLLDNLLQKQSSSVNIDNFKY